MMKNTDTACTRFLLIVVTLLLCITSSQPQYHKSNYASISLLDMYDLDDTGRDLETSVDIHYKEYILNIFEELSQVYGVQKNAPNIGYFHPYDNVISQYSKECIYINFMDYDNIEDAKPIIAHEIIHYLSDDGVLVGFHYTLDDIYLLGNRFNEGVTNYFTTKYAPNSLYQFETHVAKIIAICYGEASLANDFFSSDITNLRNDFNNSVKSYYKNEKDKSITLTPFDMMTSYLNTYGDTFDEQEIQRNHALAIEEMLLCYAKEKGFESEVKEEIQNFATTNDFNYLKKLL